MTMLTCAHSHMVSRLIASYRLLPEWALKKAAEAGRPQINIYLPNVRGEERCTLLPVTGDVDNPMLSRSLLFIMSLVLRGGIRIIYNGSTDTAVFAIVNNPSVGGIG